MEKFKELTVSLLTLFIIMSFSMNVIVNTDHKQTAEQQYAKSKLAQFKSIQTTKNSFEIITKEDKKISIKREDNIFKVLKIIIIGLIFIFSGILYFVQLIEYKNIGKFQITKTIEYPIQMLYEFVEMFVILWKNKNSI